MNAWFDAEAERIRSILPPGRWVGVLGSTSFFDGESEYTCEEIGAALAQFPNLTILTGGVDGVGDAVSRRFAMACRAMGRVPLLYHILPDGCTARRFGETLFAGEDMRQRREILARVAKLYIVVEGGPGTRHEATIACQHEAVIVPVGRSGGHAGELHPTTVRPDWASEADWAALATANLHPRAVAAAVARLVQAAP